MLLNSLKTFSILEKKKRINYFRIYGIMDRGDYMRINQLSINEIQFHYTAYSDSLYRSIKRIGFSFPIKVKLENNQYYCLDGHKRLSILQDILKEDPFYERGHLVHVIIENNGNIRSNDCWRGRNTH